MSEAKELKAGSWIVYGGELYHVKKREVTIYGTHSHSKIKLFIQSIFGGGEKIVNFGQHEQVEEADIVRKAGQVLSKNGKSAQVMDTVNYETFDAELTDELANEVKEGDTVTFIDFKGKLSVIEKR